MFKYLSLREAEKALNIRDLILVSLDLEFHEVDLHNIIEYGMSVFSRNYQGKYPRLIVTTMNLWLTK